MNIWENAEYELLDEDFEDEDMTVDLILECEGSNDEVQELCFE